MMRTASFRVILVKMAGSGCGKPGVNKNGTCQRSGKTPIWHAGKGFPVLGITWYEANAYCKWLHKNWSGTVESEQIPI